MSDRDIRGNDTVRFDGEDVIVTDPCYLFHGSEADRGLWPECVDNGLGVINVKGIMGGTLYGDWYCNMYDYGVCSFDDAVSHANARRKKIGTFCADSGLVCVASLEDVMKFSPKFMDWYNGDECTGTIIRGFSGTASFNDANGKRHVVLKHDDERMFMSVQVG